MNFYSRRLNSSLIYLTHLFSATPINPMNNVIHISVFVNNVSLFCLQLTLYFLNVLLIAF